MNDCKARHLGTKKLAPETQMMHYGYQPSLSEGAVKCPQFQTSTFVFDSAQHGKDFFNYASGREPLPPGEEPGLIYTRFNNPVLEILEGRIALWDEAEDCLVTASGMAAISTSLLALSKPGDVVIYSEPVYGGTDALLGSILSQYQVRGIGFCSSEGAAGLAKAMEEARAIGPVSVVFVETPDNPTNQIIDIRACADLIAAYGQAEKPILIVDNTMYGPIFQQPLQHGADVSLYSLTKYIGGHSDVVGGACAGNSEVISRIRGFRNIMGTTMDPNTAWLIMRSLETLKVRMQASSASARQVAEYLQQHEQVESVLYPGFLKEGDPQHEIFQRQCEGCGSTFAFAIKGGEKEAFTVLDKMQIAMLAVSLGGTETLIQHPASMTHSCVPPERRAEIGIGENLIRISVGLENPEDIIADLEQALS
ncbi:cystathionine gamma-synthase family protein [uncultured Pseudoteredinibacter sp.]|uniref:cystathionine gamma-synthase family protein n=1 Tax=uncultured Pseudoteredinibacter sp. TaxID=1641701 RepID=UPI002638D440|nr:cystathionine gamma-synthase family protein [uncultured Pseudoteredinibacter sp.]